MGNKIPINFNWVMFDDNAARNWEQSNLSNVRQGNSARIMENLAHGVNHLLGLNPRPMVTHAVDIAEALETTETITPAVRWYYDDSIDNSRDYTFTIVAVPATLNCASNAYVEQWTTVPHNVNVRGFETNVIVPAVNKFYDAFYEILHVHRGDELDTTVDDGLSISGGYTMLMATSQDDFVGTLDTDDHIYCTPGFSQKGEPVLADGNEDIRAQFHELRSTNLPIVFHYGSQGQTVNVTAPGTAEGLKCINTVYANLFDDSLGSRTATSPGSTYDAQYCGRGLDQKNPKVLCKVLAQANGGSGTPANVKLIGPDGITDNFTIVNIPHAGSLAWHGTADNYIYLDSTIAPDDVTTDCNKIDALGQVTASGDYVNIYGIRCWIEYE